MLFQNWVLLSPRSYVKWLSEYGIGSILIYRRIMYVDYSFNLLSILIKSVVRVYGRDSCMASFS